MGKQRSSFAKLQRDRAKAAKKAEKQAARQGKGPDGIDVADLTVIDEEVEEVEEGTSLVASLVAGKGVLSAPELLAPCPLLPPLRCARENTTIRPKCRWAGVSPATIHQPRFVALASVLSVWVWPSSAFCPDTALALTPRAPRN